MLTNNIHVRSGAGLHDWDEAHLADVKAARCKLIAGG